MRVAEFYLINEKGQEYSLMDETNYCLLTEPSGLGYSYSTQYQQLGNIFITTLRNMEQGRIDGNAKFKNYDNFRSFVNFIEGSEKLKFLYKIPLKDGRKAEYLKDVNIQSVPKGYILDEDEKLISAVSFDCLSLWYQDKETVYTINKLEEELQWDFVWGTRFADYSSRCITFNNDGHVEAPLTLEMCNYLINPGFYISKNGIIVNSLRIPITINKGEKILYSSRDNELFLKKQNKDGSLENLFTQEYIDLNNNNIFGVPKGTSEITLVADNDIYDAKLNIFKQYKVV